MTAQIFSPGKVVIAAAGPGDADLVTVKTARYLQLADVILTDRLVNPEILERYARKGSELIEVGKQSGHPGSSPQQTISQLMAAHALKGKRVLRLKGGDVSIFSNILDELETLTALGISYEIVPGVTAALGAAAYAGIPLTARGYARGVRFLTFVDEHMIDASQWQDWAETSDTLVFYMSGKLLKELAQRLVSAGMKTDQTLAVISHATTPGQQVEVGTIRHFLQPVNRFCYKSPTLIIIGDVVKLHPRFKWFESSEPQADFFPPMGPAADFL
jgi:uroporphyrin-III C-methyltransferase